MWINQSTIINCRVNINYCCHHPFRSGSLTWRENVLAQWPLWEFRALHTPMRTCPPLNYVGSASKDFQWPAFTREKCPVCKWRQGTRSLSTTPEGLPWCRFAFVDLKGRTRTSGEANVRPKVGRTLTARAVRLWNYLPGKAGSSF